MTLTISCLIMNKTYKKNVYYRSQGHPSDHNMFARL